jgi:hypothetical protein
MIESLYLKPQDGTDVSPLVFYDRLVGILERSTIEAGIHFSRCQPINHFFTSQFQQKVPIN